LVLLSSWGSSDLIDATSQLADFSDQLAGVFHGLNANARNLVASSTAAETAVATAVDACSNSALAIDAATLGGAAENLGDAAAAARSMLGGTGHALEVLSGEVMSSVSPLVLAGGWSLGALTFVAVAVGLRATACKEALEVRALARGGGATRTRGSARTACPSPGAMGCGGCWGWLGHGARGKRFVVFLGSLVLALLVAEIAGALTASVTLADLCSSHDGRDSAGTGGSGQVIMA